MSKQQLPEGWDEARVKRVIDDYENETEEEEANEIEAALQDDGKTLMAIPKELVPEVRSLLARKQSA